MGPVSFGDLPRLYFCHLVPSSGLLGPALSTGPGHESFSFLPRALGGSLPYTRTEEKIRDGVGEMLLVCGCFRSKAALRRELRPTGFKSQDLGVTCLQKEGPVEGRDPCCLSWPALSLAGVGKSSLLLRFADNTFSGECAPEVLLGCFSFEIPLPGARTPASASCRKPFSAISG